MSKKYLPLLLIPIAVLFMTTSKKRGIRNNNPGNLIITRIKWFGKKRLVDNTDGKFEQFIAPHWGIRALAMDLRNDITKGGLDTVTKLITEFAPESDNNHTDKYIDFVSDKINKDKDSKISPDDLINLIPAIIRFENGEQPYSITQIAMAIQDSKRSK